MVLTVLTQPDDRIYNAVRRLRNQDDFMEVVKWVENQRAAVSFRCTVQPDEPRLRMAQGASQALADLLDVFSGEER